jgi:sugar phosphate isomerase/epimerase
MRPLFFKTLWGNTLTYREAARQAASAEFHGLEGPVPIDPDSRRQLKDALEEFQLQFIAEISTTGFAVPEPSAGLREHLDALERSIERSVALQPLIFTTMAGNDLWSMEDSIRFLSGAHNIARRWEIRLGFETHRSRSLFHPRVAQAILKEVPEVEITVDFSHWCVVCERLVMDELPDVLDMVASRALHVHLRAGDAQRAQVADPRAPSCAEAVEAHLRWWKYVWNCQSQRGFEQCTMTPEFGPDGYLQTDPWSSVPVADLWELNSHMAAVVEEQFSKLFPNNLITPGST